MNRRGRGVLATGRTRKLALAAAYLAVFSLQAVVTRSVFTLTQPGGNDFYPRWAGGCAWLLRGENPYAESTTLAIQQGIYGRPAQPGEDQAAFAYPVYVIVLTWPLCLAKEFSLVQAIWMTALTHLLIAAAILARRLSRWIPAPRLWPWVLPWAVLVYPNARAVLLGQLAVVVAALILGSLESIRLRRDALAGILLALATVKPQMVFLFVPWILVWSAAQHRWRIVLAFAASLAALIFLPMLWLPSWPVDFLAQLKAYTSYTELQSVLWIVVSYYAKLPGAVLTTATVLVLAWLAWEWYRSRSLDLTSMLWTASLTLVVTHFVAPRTATTHFAPLMLPLFMAFALSARRWGPASTPGVVSLLGVLLVGTWWLFLATVMGRQESALTYLPIPVALAIALPWMRSSWMSLARETA
jgi:hypothetical protein